MYVAVKDLEGVESAKVSLNRGLLILELAPENKLTLSQLRDLVRSKGFTPRHAKVVARGRLAEADGKTRFTVAGSGESWDVAAAPAKRAGELTMEGVVHESARREERDRLEITTVP